MRRKHGPEIASPSDVKYCYRILLGREPDPAGLRHYTDMVTRQPVAMATLFELFIRSPEFRSRLRDTYFWSSDQLELVHLVGGHSLYVSRNGDPDISGAIKKTGEYEPDVTAALQFHLSEGDCFVDVGASIGYFTILAGCAVGERGRVIACEPGPQNQSTLLLNIALNHLTNVEVAPVALSDQRGVVSYSRLGSNGAISSYQADVDSIVTGDLVQAKSMDELLANADRVDVIKIDVEGAEGKVLEGARATLGRFHPKLFFEFTPAALELTSAVTGSDLLHRLESFGYGFTVLTGRAGPVEDLDQDRAEEVMTKFERLGGQHIDVLAIAGTVTRR